MPTPVQQVGGALVVALQDAKPGDTTPAAVQLMQGIAPGDRVDVGQAAIDLGANWDSVNKTIDAAQTVGGDPIVADVTPTYVTCETASPETIALWKMPCVYDAAGGAHTPTGGLPFVAAGVPASNLKPSSSSSGWALLFAVLGGITFGATLRYAKTRYRRA